MAIDISGYNGDFKAFVDFASSAKKESAIAQVSGETNAVAGTGSLAGRTIIAKTMRDSIGNVGRLSASRDVNNAVRDIFMRTVINMFGGIGQIPESVQNAMKLQDYGKGRPLTARRIKAVDAAIKAEIEAEKAFREKAAKIGFGGKGGEMVAKICVHDKTLLENENPAAEFKRRMNENCKDYMKHCVMTATRQVEGNRTVGYRIKPVSVAPSEAFLFDFRRGTGVTIDGVKYISPENSSEEEKEKAFKDVCDAFVRFVTGNKDATFDTASREDKIKANTLMICSCQKMASVVTTGAGLALDPERSAVKFDAGTGMMGKSFIETSFSKDQNGNILFNCKVEFDGAMLTAHDEKGKIKPLLSNDASVKYSFKGTIPKDGFDSFAKADWEGMKGDKLIELRDIDIARSKGWLDNFTKGIPEPYRLEIKDVDSSFSVEAEELREPF